MSKSQVRFIGSSVSKMVHRSGVFAGYLHRLLICAKCSRSPRDFNNVIRRLMSTNFRGGGGGAELGGDGVPFRPKRALVVSKLSRYAFERKRYSQLGEDGLKKVVCLLSFSLTSFFTNNDE